VRHLSLAAYRWKYGPPENLGDPINTAGMKSNLIAPDESYLIFAGTGLTESWGAYDLYISFRRGGQWTKPRNRRQNKFRGLGFFAKGFTGRKMVFSSQAIAASPTNRYRNASLMPSS
jgi:hypothetical protein